MVLDKRRDYKRRRLIEVYDHPQPSPRLEIPTEEAFATRRRIVLTVIRATDGTEVCGNVREHLRSAPLQMSPCALVEDNRTAVGIGRVACWRLHSG